MIYIIYFLAFWKGFELLFRLYLEIKLAIKLFIAYKKEQDVIKKATKIKIISDKKEVK